MPPSGNTNPSQAWDGSCSTPAPDPNPERRSDQATFQTVAPYPLARATSLDATVSQTPDRHQHGAYDVYSADRDQRDAGKPAFVEIDDVAQLAEALAGVRRTAPEGLAVWRYHGRLIARQLDDEHVVIRADFDYRDSMLRQFPETFSVPAQYAKHMMVVADLISGDAGAIEDALEAAWQLQRSAS